MNIDKIRYPRHKKTSPDQPNLKPSELGLIKMKASDGEVTELRMNRADRRRFIKENKLRKEQ